MDILLIFETKLDDAFPKAQFNIDGFCKPYRHDYCSNGRNILHYIRDDISSRLLIDYKVQDGDVCLFAEINN